MVGTPMKIVAPCRAMQPRPQRRVGGALVHDRRVAAVERIHEPGAEHVGPVVLAGVQHAVARRIEVEPVGRRRLAAEQRAMRVQHALRIARRARGVDQVGGIVGARGMRRLPPRDRGQRRIQRVQPRGAGPARRARRRPAPPRATRAGPRTARASRPSVARSVTSDDRARIGADESHLVGRQHRRRRHRHGATLERAQERRRVGETVGQADQHAIARATAEVAQQLREAARPLRQRREGERLDAGGVAIDDHRVARRQRRSQVRVGARHPDVEVLGDVPDPGRERLHRPAAITPANGTSAGLRPSRMSSMRSRTRVPYSGCVST